MKYEREKAKPIENVSEAQLLRGLGYMKGISSCRISILTDDDGSYLQIGGSGMSCCLEWRDTRNQQQYRAFKQPPVVPWTEATKLPVSGGDVVLQQDEYFRIQQVTEAFVAFFHHKPFPPFIKWRDITDELERSSLGLKNSNTGH